MIGAVRAPHKCNSVTLMRFKVYEEPEEKEVFQATPLVNEMKLKEVHVNIQAQKDSLLRIR